MQSVLQSLPSKTPPNHGAQEQCAGVPEFAGLPDEGDETLQFEHRRFWALPNVGKQRSRFLPGKQQLVKRDNSCQAVSILSTHATITVSSDDVEPDRQALRILESPKVSERPEYYLLRGVLGILRMAADLDGETIDGVPEQPDCFLKTFRGIDLQQICRFHYFWMHFSFSQQNSHRY